MNKNRIENYECFTGKFGCESSSPHQYQLLQLAKKGESCGRIMEMSPDAICYVDNVTLTNKFGLSITEKLWIYPRSGRSEV